MLYSRIIRDKLYYCYYCCYAYLLTVFNIEGKYREETSSSIVRISQLNNFHSINGKPGENCRMIWDKEYKKCT